MKSRITSWIVALALLSGLLTAFELPAANAASSTTTAVTVSDSNPRRGDAVVFTITVTPSAYIALTPITGNVIISSNKGELCATYSLTEIADHKVQASCTWIAVSDAGNINAVYKGSTNYTTSQSSNIAISVIEISYFRVSRVNEGSSLTIEAGATNAGTLAFKVDGVVITGCNHESKTVTSGSLYKTCSYTLPIANSAASGTKLFSVDYIPETKNIMRDAFVISYTPDKYYLPTTEGMYSSILSNFKDASSKAPFVSANYVEVDHVFYKLNRSSREALVVGYDRFAGLTELNIPENLNVTSAVLSAVSAVSYPSKNDFIGTYQVSAIGTDAFSMGIASPTTGATLLRTVVLPPTLKIIGDRAFKGQCGISEIDIPDSVLAIGTDAFAAMNTTGAVNGQGYKMCTVAFSSSTAYTYSASVNANAHVTYAGHVYSAKQSMSAPSALPTDSSYWLDLGAQAPITGLTDIKIGAGVSATGSSPFYAAGNLQKVAFRGAPSDLQAVYEYRRSGLDLWGWTDAAAQNWTMRHPISDPSNNTCTNYFVYAGSLQISILASQSLAWQYWAQGCLAAGADGIKAAIFKPSRPAAPTTETTTLTSTVVRFTAPTSDGGASIENYSVQFSSTDWATWETFTSMLSSPTTPFTVTGLSPSTNYKFRIIATNSAGPSIPSATSAAISTLSPTVPDAPTIGTATVASTTSIAVSFTASAYNGGSAIESYTVTSTPDSVKGYFIGSGSGTATLTGLRPGITYSFAVRAGNSVGLSTSSSSVTKKLPLTPVLGAWANITKTKADAPFVLIPPTESYTAAGTFGYTSSNPGIVSVSQETVTVVQSGSAVITATFYPTNTDDYFSGVTKTLTVTVSAQANAITFGALSSRAVNSGAFNLGATVTGGAVTYSSVTSASICTVTSGGSVSMFAPGTCVLKASSLGNASYGAAESVTQNLVITAAPPGAPALISVSVGGTDAASATSGYATLQFTANTENGGSITSYTLTATPATGSAITSTVTAAAGTRSGTISGLTLGTSYTYSVTAYNGGTTGGGTSAVSNTLSKTPVASPNAPTNLSVTPGNQSLLVKWTKPTNLGGGSWDSYQIYIKPSADANFPSETVTAISNQNIESVTVTALASGAQLVNGVAYDVQIWAKTSANGASLSTNTVAVYLIPATVPAAPRFALSQTDTTTVTASWASNGDGGSALTGYTINLSSGACSFSFVSGTTSYSCAVTGLTAGTTVTASAIATNLMGNSAASTAASVTYISTVGAPTSLVSADGNAQASISFAINTNGDTVVNYEYSTDGVSFEPLTGTTSPLTILGLTNGTTYNVSLRAKGSTYGIGATSSSVVVRPFVPVAVNTTPAIVNRSSFKALTLPKISRSNAGFTCSAGTYQFIRSTGAVEIPNISGQIFNLIANGEVVESLASLMTTAFFADRPSFEGSTLYCQIQIKQEDVDEKFTSLDKVIIEDIDLAQTETLRMVNELFYSERDLAYLSRVQGNSASTTAWKKALEAASAKRLASIEKANVDYISALESSGISVLKQEKAVVPQPEPVTEKPVEPSIKVPNVQPTVEMRKIGSIYFANGTYFINDASKRTLRALAAQIKSDGPRTVLSYGHTDQKGGVDNVLLSKNRSIAIAKYLKSLIPNQKIVTGWFASTKPVAKGKSVTDLAKNRRVEIYVK